VKRRCQPQVSASERRWEALFRKWFDRLVPDPGWRVRFAPDEHAETAAAYSCEKTHREVVFRYKPSHAPSDLIACHEVSHLLLVGMQRWADHCCDEIAEPARSLARKGFTDKIEEAADDLARAFCRAYGESDG